MKIEKTTKTASGKIITITGTLATQKTINADGHNVTVDCCEIDISVSVEGHGSQGTWIKKMDAAEIQARGLSAEYTHIVGKLPLTDEQVDLIASVRGELESQTAQIENLMGA